MYEVYEAYETWAPFTFEKMYVNRGVVYSSRYRFLCSWWIFAKYLFMEAGPRSRFHYKIFRKA